MKLVNSALVDYIIDGETISCIVIMNGERKNLHVEDLYMQYLKDVMKNSEPDDPIIVVYDENTMSVIEDPTEEQLYYG